MSERRAVLVTGAGKRLGKALALRLAEEGWAVGVHYNTSSAGAEDVAARIRAEGGEAVTFGADLSDLDACAALPGLVQAEFPGLCALVNSASVFERDTLPEMTQAFFREQMRVNGEAPVFLAQALYNALGPDVRGWVLNLIDAKISQLTPDFFSYTMSKLMLEDATRMLAMACAPRLRVNGVAPGLVLRSGAQTQAEFEAVHHKTPLQRGPDTEHICDIAVMLAEAPAVTGQIVAVDGGRHFYSPSLMRDL